MARRTSAPAAAPCRTRRSVRVVKAAPAPATPVNSAWSIRIAVAAANAPRQAAPSPCVTISSELQTDHRFVHSPLRVAPRLRKLAGALLIFSVCVTANADTLDAIRARGSLRWGGDVQGGEPYAFQDPNHGSQLVGFEVEIAAALARRLGVRAEFVQNDWQNLVPSLERGDFDIILNGLEVTASRIGRIAFTQPYYAFAETLVVRRRHS